MNRPTPTELPLLAGGGCCGGGGCGCGCGAGSEHAHPTTPVHTVLEKENQMTQQSTQDFQVTGMTCGHCASAVTEEIKQLPGVGDVAVELVAGGTSTVRVISANPLDDGMVAGALDEAGDYQLA